MQPNNPLTDLNNRSVVVCYVYAMLKRWVFNLDLNWQSVSDRAVGLSLSSPVAQKKCK